MTADRPIVLTACDYYLPGYKGGGPIRTLAGIVEHLGDEFLFKMITRDHDHDEGPYPQVAANTWQSLGAGHVMYLSPSRLSLRGMRRVISETHHDVLYLNSYFSIPFAIIPLLLRRGRLIPRRPLVIAPRGELAEEALAFKLIKKKVYMAFAKLLRLTQDAIWQASGPHEEQAIRRCFGNDPTVLVAPDMAVIPAAVGLRRTEKVEGRLHLLFLSRISPMKNLDVALTILRTVSGHVLFSIFGPVEDREYWNRCLGLMDQLPPNINVEYGGVARPDQVAALMSQHDLLILPTRGENFGHVILESLAAGCPVLISDRTRWRDLEAAGVGWDVPLTEPERFGEVLGHCVAMDAVKWRQLSDRARRYGLEWLRDPEAAAQNRALFRLACGGNGSDAESIDIDTGKQDKRGTPPG